MQTSSPRLRREFRYFTCVGYDLSTVFDNLNSFLTSRPRRQAGVGPIKRNPLEYVLMFRMYNVGTSLHCIISDTQLLQSYDIWLGSASSGTPASSASAYEM